MAQQQHKDVPTLETRYSGIPSRLHDRAIATKAAVIENSTIDAARPRRLPLALPKGYPIDKFMVAIAEIRGVLGDENVELNIKPLGNGWYMEHSNTYDMFNLYDEEETVSSAAVYPCSTAEVQKIVKWANKYKIPIYPISMGRNLGYGGAAPRVRGSIIIDLGRRMNSILEINPEECTCLLEPGVSFYALYEEIQKRGYKHLWIDVPDLGGGSVIGNTCDRGVGYTPYGDHLACHSGMEVVLPTGEVIRTGMGALPGNNTWQAFPYGYGPYPDGLFTQSNFGIVTKMGMALMPNPGGHESYMYTFEKEEDIYQLVELIRPLKIRNILENIAQLKHVRQEVAVVGKQKKHYYQGEGSIPDDIVRLIAKDLVCGDCSWVYYGTAYGPNVIRQEKLKLIDDAFMSVPGAKRIDPATIPKTHYFWSRDSVSAGVPALQELDWLNWEPNGAHLFFSPIMPCKAADAKKILEIVKRRHEQFGLDLFPAFCIGLREIHLIINIVYNRGSAKGRRNAEHCIRLMIDDAAKEGYGEYRTHLLLQDQVAHTYSWNNNALMRFNETVKDALDPNGILAPGRNGIWPQKYRGKNWEIFTVGRDKVDGEAPDDFGISQRSRL